MIVIETVNFLLALGTLVMQIAGAGLLGLFFLRKRIPDLEDVALYVSEWGLWIAFVIVLGSSAVTLIYSDVFGFAACVLCWWQRIFLYPQVFLFGIAAWKKHSLIRMYSIPLSVVGGAIALYQHFLQMGVTSTAPCDAIPGTDCAARFLFEFGYITFPLMSFTLFAFLIVLMLFVRNARSQ